MNYYVTQGSIGKKSGTVVVKSRSIDLARRKLTHLATTDKTLAFDIEDLSRVTKSSRWESVHKLIDYIRSGGTTNIRDLGSGIYVDVS